LIVHSYVTPGSEIAAAGVAAYSGAVTRAARHTKEIAMTTDPGDLGRRLRARREASHLSISELASKARIDPGFLRYLEDQAAVGVDPATLFRLAEALDTSAQILLGGGVDRPPGHDQVQPTSHLASLDTDECRRLVGRRGIGRVIFTEGARPVALPVNYVIYREDVVFRTSSGSSLTAVIGHITGFQVDRVDDDLGQGWSVLFSGEASVITDPIELEDVGAFPPQPWADGDRNLYIRIAPSEISGRRLGPGMNPR